MNRASAPCSVASPLQRFAPVVPVEAKPRGLIKDVVPVLQTLMDSGYRITRERREQILRIANESV